METDVAATLEDLLASKGTWDDQTVAERVQPVQSVIPTLETSVVNLAEYDQLLNQEVYYGTD
jgi:hypothetical protein